MCGSDSLWRMARALGNAMGMAGAFEDDGTSEGAVDAIDSTLAVGTANGAWELSKLSPSAAGLRAAQRHSTLLAGAVAAAKASAGGLPRMESERGGAGGERSPVHA